MRPALDLTARFAIVTLAGRSEAPAMPIVRRLVKDGVEWVKTYPTGDAAAPEDGGPEALEMTPSDSPVPRLSKRRARVSVRLSIPSASWKCR
mgnify:CR=1 FL=1